MEQFDDDRDRQGGGNPAGYLANRKLPYSGRAWPGYAVFGPALLECPAGYPISMRSGSWRSTPPLTVISSRPSSKLAEILLLSMPSGSFILRLKWP